MKRIVDLAPFLPVIVSLSVLLAAVVLRLQEPVAVETVRNMVFDQYQRWQPRIIDQVPVQIVDIDEESIEKLGQWPWPRNLLARLVDRLVREKAAAVVFDMLFSEIDRTSPSQFAAHQNLEPDLKAKIIALPDHDQAFADALARAPSVTGFALTNKKSDLANPVVKHGLAAAGNDPKPFLLTFPGAITSLKLFDQSAKGSGAMNFSPDQDGVVRRVPLLLRRGNKVVASLAAESLRVAQGASTYIVKSAGASSEAMSTKLP